MEELFTGYEMARLISHHMLKEGTYIQQYINGEQCKTDGIYVIHNKNLYSTRPFLDGESLKLISHKEALSSLLCGRDIEYKIIEHKCEQCGLPILDSKTRDEFHGCCSSECEKEKINEKEIKYIPLSEEGKLLVKELDNVISKIFETNMNNYLNKIIRHF